MDNIAEYKIVLLVHEVVDKYDQARHVDDDKMMKKDDNQVCDADYFLFSVFAIFVNFCRDRSLLCALCRQ